MTVDETLSALEAETKDRATYSDDGTASIAPATVLALLAVARAAWRQECSGCRECPRDRANVALVPHTGFALRPCHVCAQLCDVLSTLATLKVPG